MSHQIRQWVPECPHYCLANVTDHSTMAPIQKIDLEELFGVILWMYSCQGRYHDRFWGIMPLKEEMLEAVSRMEFIQLFVLGGLPRLVIVDNRRALNIVFLEF